MKLIDKKIILLLSFICLITFAITVTPIKAQTPVVLDDPGPMGGSEAGGSGDGATVPFDGGMSLLILSAGAGYLARKLKENTEGVGSIV